MTTEMSKEEKAKAGNRADASSGIRCEIDGEFVHSIFIHLKYHHPDVSLAEYRARYPDAPLQSPYLIELARKREAAKRDMTGGAVAPTALPSGATAEPLSKVFGMRHSKQFENARGEPIACAVMGEPDPEVAMFMEPVDDNHVWEIDLLKDILTAVTLNIPMLLWGFHGTGKSSNVEQFCARTKRPYIRVQHTVSTEEAHILGQYVVKPNPETGQNTMVFEPGPLAFAMRYGLVYLADEYDFALPSVTSVYQPVLEGKALVIKEAPPEWRLVKPHPNFRFFATGNTNGSGDETGLYQGTQIMNAANYSRFGITAQVNYMEPKVEEVVVAKKTGMLPADAKRMVEFANEVRKAYSAGEISMTVSPRELINAGNVGLVRGGDWRLGLDKAFIARLGATDRKAVDDYAQRIFGGAHR